MDMVLFGAKVFAFAFIVFGIIAVSFYCMHKLLDGPLRYASDAWGTLVICMWGSFAITVVVVAGRVARTIF